jgi:hypothetical protein
MTKSTASGKIKIGWKDLQVKNALAYLSSVATEYNVSSKPALQ